MNVQQLQQEISTWDAKLSRLRDALRASQEQVSKLEAERKPCALAARVDQDKDAQKRLGQIDAELESLRRDIRDDNDAIAHASQKLATLRADLAAAEEESRREGVRRLIRARLQAGLEQRVAGLVEQLKAEVQNLLAKDQEIASALKALHPTHPMLASEAARVTDFRRSPTLIWNFIGFALRDPLLPTGEGYRNPYMGGAGSAYAERLLTFPPDFFARLLGEMDNLPSREDAAEPSVTAAD